MIKVYDPLEGNFNVNKQIRIKTPMLRLDLRDYSDAYIGVKGTIVVARGSNESTNSRPLAFENNTPFISCVSKINNVLIGNAEDFNVVMHIHNSLEYSKKYR